MPGNFPYYYKTYQPGQNYSQYPSTGYVSGMSDLFGGTMDPKRTGPSTAQNALNIWGTNLSAYEGGGVEQALGQFSSNIPTPPTQAPAPQSVNWATRLQEALGSGELPYTQMYPGAVNMGEAYSWLGSKYGMTNDAVAKAIQAAKLPGSAWIPPRTAGGSSPGPLPPLDYNII